MRAERGLAAPRGRSSGTTTVSAACAAVTPGLAGMPRRREPRARLGEQAVDVAVVGAGELDDRVAAGGRPGEPHGAHRRLGAGVDHPHHLDGAEPLGHLRRELDLAAVGAP